ncbi:MAG: trehalose-6-phosphate synthase [bacterium]
MTSSFGSAPLLVAANRGPLSVEAVDHGEDKISRGGGGLVSGMQAALAQAPGAVWVCAALNPKERSLARQAAAGRMSSIPSVSEALHGEFEVRMLPIDAVTFRRAYNGIANATLWFVLHMLYELPHRPVFDGSWRRQWDSYVRYNRAFAEALAEEAAEGATVMVQDYHLFLVPRMLRDLRPDLRIGFFTHTSWVGPDYFTILPDDVAAAVLDGILGADLIGFHTHRWATDFAACTRAVLDRDPGEAVGVFPLGLDVEALHKRASAPDCEARLRDLREQVGDRLVIGRVDRTELSKNVLRGLLAYRELLRTRPEWLERVVHLVFNYPSREDLPEYRVYVDAVEALAVEIEEEFGTDDWSPLSLEIGHDYPGSLAALRLSDVLLVNSLRDGMNLVVLEGCVLSEREPAVVLSREAGAAEVIGALSRLVNPYDVSRTAVALHDALSEAPASRAKTAARLRADAVGIPPAEWFQAQLDRVRA